MTEIFSRLQQQINRLQSQQTRLQQQLRQQVQTKRKQRTRTLIQLGGLVELSGLSELCAITAGDDLQNDFHHRQKAALLLGLLQQTVHTFKTLSPPQITLLQRQGTSTLGLLTQEESPQESSTQEELPQGSPTSVSKLYC